MRLLHQDHSRGDSYRAMAPASPEPDGEYIAVVDPDLIAAIFASPAFRVLDAAGDYRYIAGRTGIDFSPAIEALDHVPLVKEGEVHRQLRADMARLIAAGSRKAEARLRADAARFMPALLVAGRTVDLVTDVALPAYRSLFSEIVGYDPTNVSGGSEIDLSQIFDRMLSLNRRKQICQGIRAAAEKVSDFRDKETKPQLALAVTMLGQDALVGSLGTSLFYELSINQGRPLSEIKFGAMGATGVPHVERIATEDTRIGTLEVAKGQMVRLFLDATTRQTAGEDSGLTFGRGRHLCLGKPLALLAWQVLTETFRHSGLRPGAAEIKFRGGDYVFNYPEYARVTFDEG